MTEKRAAQDASATAMTMWRAGFVLATMSFAATALVFVLLPFAFAATRDPVAAVQAATAALAEYGDALAPHLVGGLSLLGAILIATLGVIVVDRRIRQDLDFQLRDNLAPFALFATAATAPAIVMVVIAAATGRAQAAGILVLAVPLFGVLAVIACYIGTYRNITIREQAAASTRAANAARAALHRLHATNPSAELPAPVRLRGRITLAASLVGVAASVPAWFFTPLGAPSLGYAGHLVTTSLCVMTAVGSAHLTVGIVQASLAVPNRSATVSAWGIWGSSHIGLVASLLMLALYGFTPAAMSAFGAALLVTLAATQTGMRLPAPLHSLSIARMSLALIAADLDRIAQRAEAHRTEVLGSLQPRGRWSLHGTGTALGARFAIIAATFRRQR